jgi:cytochrome P450
MLERRRIANVMVDLGIARIVLVTGKAMSRAVLREDPSAGRLAPGTAKLKAMSFLAPHALNIQMGERWKALRRFNEVVLSGFGERQRALLDDPIRTAFSTPVQDLAGIRWRMGQVMLAAVFGEGSAPERLAADIQELFAEVSPRTALFGSRKTALLASFREEIRLQWGRPGSAAPTSLLGLAHSVAEDLPATERSEEIILDQVPHWMFTFTNSGSDLLARTLSLIAARPDCLARSSREAVGAPSNGPARPPGVASYIEACVWEAGRLYPPSPATYHQAGGELELGCAHIPRGTLLVQYFPLRNRDSKSDPLADAFRPERWLCAGEEAKQEPELFLSGSRACPGRDLILHVIATSIACLLKNGHVHARACILSHDPLPDSYGWDKHRF